MLVANPATLRDAVMKAVFGVFSLLIVLAIVGSLARKQLQAVDGELASRSTEAAGRAAADGDAAGGRGAAYSIPGGVPGAVAADATALTVPQRSRNLQEQMRNDTARALQQGAKRNEGADR